jgi:FAD-linked oxidoreductase
VNVWRNWCGLAECRPTVFSTPRTVDEVAAAVRDARKAGRKLRVVGSGHSFTELVPTSGTLMSLDNLSGVISDGPEATSVWAGTKLHALGRLLDERGLAMENLGDIDVQSLAGAVSTGTHGTGIGLGVIATQVTSLTLVDGHGEIVECSETKDVETFKAAQVSLGALGVLVNISLRTRPAYRLRYVRRKQSFDACTAEIAAHRDGHRHFELYWFPHTETVQLKLMDVTEAPEQGQGVGRAFNDVVMENGAFGALSRLVRLAPGLCQSVSSLSAAFVSEGESVGKSYEIFASRRWVRFYEMEYGVPAERGIEALREIKEWITRKKTAVHFPLEFRFVKGDDIPLSPAHGRDTAFVAVHMYKGMPFQEYFDGAEAIFRNHGGRPHWGKRHSQGAATLRTLYPRWDAFQAVRRHLDPDGVFMNPHLERLFGA